jgi:tetratricopeptide (TPR) repeat protein
MKEAQGDYELNVTGWRQRAAHLCGCLSVFGLAFLFIGLTYNTAAAQTFDDGVFAYDLDDFERAAEIWEPLAQQGHVLSQYNIGLLYENGLGVPHRPDLAFFWYRMAALNDNDDARYNLGGLYFRGEGVERSVEQAAQVWTESANAGNPNAAYNLGVILIGDGSDEEGLRAGMIRLKQASDAGHPNATELLESLSRVAKVPESLFFSIAPEVPAIAELAMPSDPLPTPELPPQAEGSLQESADYRTTTGLAYGDDPLQALEIGRRWIELQPGSRYTVKVFSFNEADVALWYLKQWGFGGAWGHLLRSR